MSRHILKGLFSPVKIGSMDVKNRMLMPAMSINFGVDQRMHVTEQLTAYFKERAKGGVGMMLVGGGAVHPTGLELPKLPALWDDDCIPALQKMTEEIKLYNSKFGMQLLHGGRQSYLDDKVAPSPIAAPAVVKGIPKELNQEEILSLIASFGDAARRCCEAGFDFIEIHGAHGYLINQFLSPNANVRTDEYGGSFENRTRFLMAIIKDIRTKTGDDFPIGVRINGEDYIDGGMEITDTIRLAPLLEKEGVAYVHVSAGVYGSRQLTIPSMYVEEGCFAHLAAAVKPHVKIPVIAVGRIRNPEYADKLIREEKADIVAFGRALLADPQYPNKVKNKDVSRIRPCIGCCLGCIHQALQLEPGSCVVNPRVGREYLIPEQPEKNVSQKILIIGAGPGGLYTAQIAAQKGHRILIVEESGFVGGVLRLAGKAPGRSAYLEFIDYLQHDLANMKVEIRLNAEVNNALLTAFKPDKVIIATGSMPEMPIIKGLFKADLNVTTAIDVIEGKTITGQNVIVLGGSQAALIVADYLGSQGKNVVVLNRKAHFGQEMSSNDRFYLRERLNQKKVKLYKKIKIREFSNQGLVFMFKQEEIVLKDFESIVITEKMTPIKKIIELIEAEHLSYELVGDAKNPQHLHIVLHNADEVARSL